MLLKNEETYSNTLFTFGGSLHLIIFMQNKTNENETAHSKANKIKQIMQEYASETAMCKGKRKKEKSELTLGIFGIG